MTCIGSIFSTVGSDEVSILFVKMITTISAKHVMTSLVKMHNSYFSGVKDLLTFRQRQISNVLTQMLGIPNDVSSSVASPSMSSIDTV